MKPKPKNRKRPLFTLTLDPEVVSKFRAACGLVPMSRQIEELMKKWITDKGKKP